MASFNKEKQRSVITQSHEMKQVTPIASGPQTETLTEDGLSGNLNWNTPRYSKPGLHAAISEGRGQLTAAGTLS